VNIIAGAVGLYSLHVAAKPKDADHPYGHGKAEFISAALEGTLIIVAGVFIIYKAIESLFINKELVKLDTGVVLIGITALINLVTGVVCVRTGKKNNSLQLVSGGKHLLTDTYSTAAVMVGLFVIHISGLYYLDSIIAGIISLVIIYTGYKILRTSLAGIMDEADTMLLENMVDLLNKNRTENWIDLHNVRFIKYGSTLHCDCHLTVPWYLNVNEAHHEIERLASLIRQEFGASVEMFVHNDGCKEYSCPICSKQNCLVRQHPFQKKIVWTIENISEDSRHTLGT
jgi:cation diffusion facilitator family transporter